MTVEVARTFNGPIGFGFFLKPAGVANEFVYLPVGVFSGGNAVDFAAVHPGYHLPAAFFVLAIAVRIHRIEEPNPAFESESTVGQCTYRAHINYVPAEIVVNSFLDVGTDFRMIPSVDDAMHALFRELIGHIHTTEAHDTARHVEFDVGANVNFFEGTALKFVAGAGFSVLKREVLQVAFACLIADGAIERVIDEQELRNRRPGFRHSGIAFAGHFHAVHDGRLAGSHEFGHGARVFFRAFGDTHEAGAAFTARAFQRGVIAHGRGHQLAANLTCGIQDGGAFCDFYGLSVYGNFCHFIARCILRGSF